MGMPAWVVVALLAETGDELAKGRQTFLDRCSMCHGEEANGHGPLADELPLKPRNFLAEPLRWGNSKRSIVDTVTHGRLNVMPSFDGALTRAEIEQVATNVWSVIPEALKRGDQSPAPHPTPKSRVFLIHQRGKVFTPSEVKARVGDTLVFVNEDEVDHEVHALGGKPSPAIRSQKPLQWDRVLLDQPGALRFGCAIHPAMRLDVKVTP